jgi:hypothetical protein
VLVIMRGLGLVENGCSRGWELAESGWSAFIQPMSDSGISSDPVQIRPLLHAGIDRLSGENLLLMHRIAMQLELEEVTARLNDGFDEDRLAEKLARLPEIIREARAAIRH